MLLAIAKHNMVDGAEMAYFFHVLDDPVHGEVGHSAAQVVTEVLEVALTKERGTARQDARQLQRWRIEELFTASETIAGGALKALIETPILVLNIHVVRHSKLSQILDCLGTVF